MVLPPRANSSRSMFASIDSFICSNSMPSCCQKPESSANSTARLRFAGDAVVRHPPLHLLRRGAFRPRLSRPQLHERRRLRIGRAQRPNVGQRQVNKGGVHEARAEQHGDNASNLSHPPALSHRPEVYASVIGPGAAPRRRKKRARRDARLALSSNAGAAISGSAPPTPTRERRQSSSRIVQRV